VFWQGGSTLTNKVAACVLFAVGALAVACGASSTAVEGPKEGAATAFDGSVATPASGNLPCDVDAILAKNCSSCHGATPKFGAPMPLVTLADLHADAKFTPGKKVFEVVGTRTKDNEAPMPQPPNARLGASDQAVLDKWIAAGAPGGNAACADAGGGTTDVKPLSCTPDQKIRPGNKFAVPVLSPTEPDLYVCYGFDVDTKAQKRHVIAGAPFIDNSKVVHHILVYQSDNAVSPTPTSCGAGGGKDWRLVMGWAPGGGNFELPVEAGFPEEAGVTHWAVQIHYNNGQGLSGQLDESGFDLCSTDVLRPNDADVLATGTVQINIPPRTTHSTTCELSIPQAFGSINVVSSWAHMHKLGAAQYAKRVRGGEEQNLLDVPVYDFNTGASAAAVNTQLAPGDTVRTMCKWKNPGDTAVKFGEATGDEMCFAFLTYYPRIKNDKFHWMAPSLPLLSKCTTKNE